jgi:pimeloyl-ACP methyl ester carboxylesterase
MRQSFKLVVGEDLKPLYKKVDVDTLLIFGKLDKETPLYMAKKQRKFIKNSKLIVLKDTGHFCFIDRADVFNQIVFAFLMGKAQKNSKI